MLTTPMDVLTQFPVRKTKKQKQVFREAVRLYLENLGYAVREETGRFGCRNLVIGDPEKASCLVGAHYDTCATLPVPNLLTPCNLLSYLGYQAFITALMVLPCFLIAVVGAILEIPQAVVGRAAWLSVFLMALLMLAGPANQSNANDNTSGVVTLLEIARTMPANQRDKVCFVLFDLEEAGLIGSASYRRAHKKATENQILLNLDCVGDGNHIRFFPTKKLRKDRKKLTSLYKACGYFGDKDILIREKGFAVYPSDQKNFPYGVGICALRPSKFGLYLGRIHTKKDTVLDPVNVNLLRAALTTFITT